MFLEISNFTLNLNHTMKISRPLVRKSISPNQFRNFIFAGRSIFTLENNETGNYLTFRVKQMKRHGQPIDGQFTVECKSLGDKDYGYKLLGFVNIEARRFKRRYWDNSHLGVVTWMWLLKNIERLEAFSKLAIYHEGHCCKCGLPLTVPESIDSGIGPECQKRVYAKSIGILQERGLWNGKMTYEENFKNALEQDPSLWGMLIIPEGFKKDDDYLVHRVLKAWDIF